MNGQLKSGSAKSAATNSGYRSAKQISLLSCPFTTINYFLRESLFLLYKSYLWLLSHVRTTALISLVAALILSASTLNGPHLQYLKAAEKQIFWCAYWIGLGILSSVGLGTGLHTFLLYLGPHIASVTLAAYECDSVDFPQPPYPEEIICPEKESDDYISIWTIMSKVRLEAFMWGAGTALGELPPYFMARASRLSGQEMSDSETSDTEEDSDDLKKAVEKKKAKRQWYLKAKESVKTLVEKVGFFGILACASVPNPLFDLAGITCGHFLVPFWTFFGATLIGKAVIKMHIQKLFVIIAFNEHHFEWFVEKIRLIPYFGKIVQEPFRDFLNKQKASLHRKATAPVPQEVSWLSWIFEKFVVAMIVYFVVSIVNSMARDYFKRVILKDKPKSHGPARSVSTPTTNVIKKPKKKVALD